MERYSMFIEYGIFHNMAKMLALPNLLFRLNAIPFKYLASYSRTYWITDFEGDMERQKCKNSQDKIEKEQSHRTDTTQHQDVLTVKLRWPGQCGVG